MIPKIIHYCWLSDDIFPDNIQKCIESWKKNLPDYEFILWDTKRFPLENSIWVKQAFETKKYAFAADYIRLYAVYNYGGIYLDSDVEVLKGFDELLELPYFVGTEGDGIIEAGVFGAEKKTDWLGYCLEYYEGKTFVKVDGSFDTVTLPKIMMKQIGAKRKIVEMPQEQVINNRTLLENKDFLYLFSKEYFCAKNLGTGELENTINTYTIHHFAMSWILSKNKFLPNLKRKLMSVLGVKTISWIIRVFKLKEIKDILIR
ncbi:glycosyltransferase family 32 protein [Flavobacterium sp. MAHUQ-51]|uniref:glycosyltransferase family 32 protein n=1 Tax=Flavobacterium sp. GCM10022190 TaxID=3252639 RepID=UPI0036155360